ncbi:type III restriction endonuclease subunit M [Trinickia dabaoshanensis]|uniref:site-specific DNA-methyltransferase (adenine-specific) n=1 Tax=Trinickia dabaoshanensis TaxID=564714 RepID=A0A2N7VHC7_9BURK|nr:site-specific DNA-methyltransferase [Trinickia dabaoshanensis]PMS16550.1 type III restriction endonuclease subunit M [Trinickia dabaoshanensis]
MPTLHWVGKDKVVNHHHDVPFRLLDKQYSFSAKESTPTNSTNNRIIHGDNLEALKSLLPAFEGKVNCIYIDPPYNTGEENWIYNDAVNDPKIKKWLGQVVGKEGEDLSRHDKWLCMMYPRLKLLHRLLADDGVIFISIDDNEQATLKLIVDEIFGSGNFLANFIWEKRTNRENRKMVSVRHDYVLAYCKSSNLDFNVLKQVPMTEKALANYKNPDGDVRGLWKSDPATAQAGHATQSQFYTLIAPNGKRHELVSGRCWLYTEEVMRREISEGKIWFGKDGNGVPRVKTYLNEKERGLTPETIFFASDAGTNESAKAEIKNIFNGLSAFQTPKSVLLVEMLLQLATSKNSIILDSFSGSGTTAHAVLKLNAKDGGNRRFILCEMMDYTETITAERVRRVINGYGEGNKAVAGTGGGFDYYTVGAAFFKEDKNLNEEVGADAIRDYVAYTESIPPSQQFGKDNPITPYALGATETALLVFYYERDRITTLDLDFLAALNIKSLPSRPEQFVIYADKCALDKDFLYKHSITFKRIPRDITRF